MGMQAVFSCLHYFFGGSDALQILRFTARFLF